MPSPVPPAKIITFADFQASQPSTPLPATSLDSQVAELIRSCTEIIDFLALIQRSDGALQNNSVGEPQLSSGTLQSIIDDLASQIAPLQAQLDTMQSQIDSSTAAAAQSATDADQDAIAAQQSANSASAALSAVQAIQSSLQSYVDSAQASATAAQSSETSFQQAEARAEFYENSAYLWAEYMAGPVVNLNDPSVYPASVDDGLWSSKYWATLAAQDGDRAEQALASFYKYYYGEWDSANPRPGMPDDGSGNPQFDPNGDPPVQGAMYFSVQEQMLKVYTATGWAAYGTAQDAVVHVGDAPPTMPVPGTYWFKSDVGVLYLYYQDQDSTQWVGVSAGNLDLRGIIKTASDAITLNNTTHLNAKIFGNSVNPTTVTIPTQANAGFKIGQLTNLIQVNTGQITVSPDPGVTILSPDNLLSTRTQSSEIQLTYAGDDQWSLQGDLA